GFAIEKLIAAPAWLPVALFVGAYYCGGFFTLREAIGNLKRKRFEIDTLMLVAAAGAAALGAWAEGALLLFLFSLGHALEHYAMGRAKRAIEALAELAPETALVLRDGKLQELPVEALLVGDVVTVKPDERIAADGFVLKGTTSVNQAPVTGESLPVGKGPQDTVFAGSINGEGLLEIRATKVFAENTISRIIKLVEEAQERKGASQRFIERFGAWYSPAVLALVALIGV
ncbi:MAG: HAD-IC family P-type ATPase, partial [Bradyrhizobium sp.]|nr:HAD-IC family P-type ATPase [Bradyrhizobium sp.]